MKETVSLKSVLLPTLVATGIATGMIIGRGEDSFWRQWAGFSSKSFQSPTQKSLTLEELSNKNLLNTTANALEISTGSLAISGGIYTIPPLRIRMRELSLKNKSLKINT